MLCPDEATLVAMIERELDPEQLRALETHFDGCAACSKLVAELAAHSRGAAMLGTTLGVDVPAPEGDGLIGTTIAGRYRVQARLGQGGMGTVFLAHDPTLGRDVALKLHHANANHERLQREAFAMAKLAHPNVVNVFEVGTVDDQVYVAMEYVRGTTLRGWLEGEHDWRRVLAVLIEAGRGLAAAHDAGLVHRDFKPENVLVGSDGRPRVSDFGLARLELVDEGDAVPESMEVIGSGPIDSAGVRMTITGTVLGTPAYMAPEQFVAAPVDARCDQFAFCVVAWEALYGKRPFAGATLAELRRAITRRELRRSGRDVPARIGRVLERGLEPDSDARYLDMRTLLAALERAAVPRTRRRRALAGLGAVAAGANAVGAHTPSRAHRRDPACDDAGDPIRRTFGVDVRADVHRAFLATGSPFAESAFEHAAAVLDRHTGNLADRAVAACHKDPAGSALAERRQTCLATMTGELGEYVTMLRRASADTVLHAADGAWSLIDPTRCEDTRILAGPELPPIETATATAYAEVLATSHAGRFKDAIALGKTLLGKVRANHERGVELDLLLQIAQDTEEVDKPEAAVAILQQAETLAETLGRDRDAAGVLGTLATAVGVDQRDYAAAHHYIDLANAKLDRLGGDTDGQRAQILAIGSQVLMYETRFAEAEADARKAIDVFIRVYGPENPKVGVMYGTLSEILRGEAKLPESLAASEQTLKVLTAALGPDHPMSAGAELNLATALTDVGRYDEARDRLLRAQRGLTRVYGDRHPVLASVAGNLGNVERATHHYDAALAAYRRALAIVEGNVGAEAPDAAGVHRDLSVTYAQLGDAESALREAERAVAILEHVKDDPRLPAAVIGVAECQLGRGKPQLALPIAERGLALAAKAPDDGDIPLGRFVVARALWETSSDRPRALGLAEQALAAERDPDRKRDVEAWLAAHRTQLASH